MAHRPGEPDRRYRAVEERTAAAAPVEHDFQRDRVRSFLALKDGRCGRPRSTKRLTRGQVQVISESMLAQCETLGRLPLPPLRVDIRGGLDSRLVVALVKRVPAPGPNSHAADRRHGGRCRSAGGQVRRKRTGSAACRKASIPVHHHAARGVRHPPGVRYEGVSAPATDLSVALVACRAIRLRGRDLSSALKATHERASPVGRAVACSFADYHQRRTG